MTVSCPHCSAANPAGSAFCESCGKALPGAISGSPRVVTSGAVASTSAGLKLQSDEAHKQAMKAANALLAVAIIQTILGGVVYAIMASNPRAQGMSVSLVVIFGVAALFWGLYIWARKNPLPAAIVGLAVYATLSLIDFVAGFAAMANSSGSDTALNNPLRGIVMKIIIIVVLVKAIQAGLLHRKLMQQQGGQLA
jgi:hypothetical protein